MKKKTIEKQAEQRLRMINDRESLLANRKEQIRALKVEIKSLKEEVEGYKQVQQILEAIIIEGIEKKDEVCIPIEALSKGLKVGYKFDIRDGMYIITKSDFIPV